MNTDTIPATKAEAEYKTITFIKRYLERVIAYIARTHSVEGRLPEEWQYAVRMLRSRQRQIDREYAMRYGTEQQKIRAHTELSINKDDGSLVQLGQKKHSRGWLGCRACDIDASMQSKARLCLSCKHGVQHAYNVFQTPEGQVLPSNDEVIDLRGNAGPVTGIRIYVWECDNCSHRTTEQ
jgi:hypothetical protein